MNKDSITYTQCYWHANGNLVCKKVTVPNNKNKFQEYHEFNSFSCPNKNYKPNAYRDNFDYYQSPPEKMCGADCNCNPRELPNQWLSVPRSYKLTKYLDK